METILYNVHSREILLSLLLTFLAVILAIIIVTYRYLC